MSQENDDFRTTFQFVDLHKYPKPKHTAKTEKQYAAEQGNGGGGRLGE